MSKAVDLRSDTITRPSPPMRQAMFEAPVGDDVFDEDPTIHALQDAGARLLGKEAALFVPSGTMANQLSLLVHCRQGDDVIAGKNAHIYLYESGAGSAIAGVNFSVLGTSGHFSGEEVADAIKETDSAGHIPPTTLVCLENSHNRGGGIVMTPESMAGVSSVCRARGLALHLDGARLFNAAVSLGVDASDFGREADTISVCLSKGLGAPVGSLLCGSAAHIKRAHRYRKMMGGGMRQAGVIAAAGLFALEHHIQDLARDHAHAQALAQALERCPNAHIDADRVVTNIVIFDVLDRSAQSVCERVSEHALILPVGPKSIRAVFHRDISESDASRAIGAICGALS